MKRFILEPYNYQIWILILFVTLHGVAIAVFVFEHLQKKWTAEIADDVKLNHDTA